MESVCIFAPPRKAKKYGRAAAPPGAQTLWSGKAAGGTESWVASAVRERVSPPPRRLRPRRKSGHPRRGCPTACFFAPCGSQVVGSPRSHSAGSLVSGFRRYDPGGPRRRIFAKMCEWMVREKREGARNDGVPTWAGFTRWASRAICRSASSFVCFACFAGSIAGFWFSQHGFQKIHRVFGRGSVGEVRFGGTLKPTLVTSVLPGTA